MSDPTDGAAWAPEEATPASLVPELAKTVVGAALAFFLIVAALSYFLGVERLYALAAFGLLYSLQATYYSYRASTDPGYRIEGCGCRGSARDETASVLRSPEGSLLGVPNGLVGVGWYAALTLLMMTGHASIATPLAGLALLASAYLAYVMVVRIRALCTLCINTLALNGLIVWHLWSAFG